MSVDCPNQDAIAMLAIAVFAVIVLVKLVIPFARDVIVNEGAEAD